MGLTELNQRIGAGENYHSEFKEKPPRPDDLAAEIVAFANSDGGEIFLGVDDHGKLVGVEGRDRAMQIVDNVAYHDCEPPVTVVQETIQDDGGHMIVIVHVAKGTQRPYRTNRRVYYLRTSSGRRQASREELLRIFQTAQSLYYDETPVLGSTPADVENQAVGDLLALAGQQGYDVEGIEQEQLLQNWRLLRRDNDATRLSIAGALFLARDPIHFVPHAYMTAPRIPGTDIANEPSDQKRIGGRMLQMVEDGIRFLHLHLPRPHRIQGLEPEARPEFPAVVLRELLVNALAHRDYTISAPIPPKHLVTRHRQSASHRAGVLSCPVQEIRKTELARP